MTNMAGYAGAQAGGLAARAGKKRQRRRVGTASPGQATLGSPTGPSTIGTAPVYNQPDTSPSTGVLGGDPGVMGAEDSGLRDTQLADAGFVFANNQIGADYGFDATGGIDPNNPYSRAALLQESYKRSQRGTQTSMAARGQLHSGAYGRAQDEVGRNYNIGYDRLQKGYTREKGTAVTNLLSAYTGAAGGISDATFEALLNKLKGGS